MPTLLHPAESTDVVFRFGPSESDAAPQAAARFVDLLHPLGHAYAGPRLRTDGGQWLARVRTSEPAAVAPERFGPRVREALLTAEAAFERPVQIECDRTPSRPRPPFYTLATVNPRDGGPLLRMADFRVPESLAVLPLDEATRERTQAWAAEVTALCGPDGGSPEAYARLADPAGPLMREGRGISATIEAACGVSTYLNLWRRYGYPGEAKRRRCSVCGGPWHRPADGPGRPQYRCDLCRLSSWPALVTVGPDDPNWPLAAVGWAGPVMG